MCTYLYSWTSKSSNMSDNVLNNLDSLPIRSVVLASTAPISSCRAWLCYVVAQTFKKILFDFFGLNHTQNCILIVFGVQCCRSWCVQHGHRVIQILYQNNDVFRVMELSEYVLFYLISGFIVLVLGFYLIIHIPYHLSGIIYFSLEVSNLWCVCWEVEAPTSSSTSLVTASSSMTASS